MNNTYFVEKCVRFYQDFGFLGFDFRDFTVLNIVQWLICKMRLFKLLYFFFTIQPVEVYNTAPKDIYENEGMSWEQRPPEEKVMWERKDHERDLRRRGDREFRYVFLLFAGVGVTLNPG